MMFHKFISNRGPILAQDSDHSLCVHENYLQEGRCIIWVSQQNISEHAVMNILQPNIRSSTSKKGEVFLLVGQGSNKFPCFQGIPFDGLINLTTC